MSGIYFVYTELYHQCWISTSKSCRDRIRFIKKILQDDTAQSYFIATDSLKEANVVFKEITRCLADYHDSDNWFNLSALQAGRFIQRVENYVWTCSFPPYEDSDDCGDEADQSVKRQRIG